MKAPRTTNEAGAATADQALPARRARPRKEEAPVTPSPAAERPQDSIRREMYMMWFDDTAKKPVSLKIEEAVAAYVKHFRIRPNIVLVNEMDQASVAGVHVRSESFVRRDNFWVGWEDAA